MQKTPGLFSIKGNGWKGVGECRGTKCQSGVLAECDDNGHHLEASPHSWTHAKGEMCALFIGETQNAENLPAEEPTDKSTPLDEALAARDSVLRENGRGRPLCSPPSPSFFKTGESIGGAEMLFTPWIRRKSDKEQLEKNTWQRLGCDNNEGEFKSHNRINAKGNKIILNYNWEDGFQILCWHKEREFHLWGSQNHIKVITHGLQGRMPQTTRNSTT